MRIRLQYILPTFLTLLFAASCVPKVEAEKFDPGCSEITDLPEGLDTNTLLLMLDSNIKDYVSVDWVVNWTDSKGYYGNFNQVNSRIFEAEAGKGFVSIAFIAQQTADFPAGFFDSGAEITFSITAALITPSGGERLVWGGLHKARINSEKDFKTFVLDAVNEGIPGALNGTGKGKYVELGIGLDDDGNYTIHTRWLNGGLFK